MSGSQHLNEACSGEGAAGDCPILDDFRFSGTDDEAEAAERTGRDHDDEEIGADVSNGRHR